ncbi:MAG: transcriptional regulator YeiL [Anaerofustis sp.]
MERIHKRTSAQSEGINESTIGIMNTEVTETVRFLSGETIISSQHSVDYLYLMRQGKAKICLTHENGKLSIIEFIGSGEYLGELTFLGIETQPKDVIALTECICLRVPMTYAMKQFSSDADFLFALSQYLGKKLMRRSWFQSKMQSYELKNRLAAHILLLETDGIYREKHTETAEYLGVSYRHLLYTFKEFLDDGFLVKAKQGYLVNREKLEPLSADILVKQNQSY